MEPDIKIMADFKKRRSQKNWVVLSIVLGCVALVWIVTLVKLQNGG